LIYASHGSGMGAPLLFFTQCRSPGKDKLEPLPAKLEQFNVIPGNPAPLLFAEGKLLNQLLLVCKASKSINIVTNHKGQLLFFTRRALTLPGIAGKEGIHLHPEGIDRIVCQQVLAAEPADNGAGFCFGVAKAVRVADNKIVLFRPGRGILSADRSLQGIASTGGWPSVIDLAAIFSEEGADRRNILGKEQSYFRKVGVIPADQPDMTTQENLRIKAEGVFEADDIVGVKGQVHLAAAYGETLDSGMTGKGKMALTDRFHPRREALLGIFCQSDTTPCSKTGEKKADWNGVPVSFLPLWDTPAQLSAAGDASMTSS
jgi:hypothetical protein